MCSEQVLGAIWSFLDEAQHNKDSVVFFWWLLRDDLDSVSPTVRTTAIKHPYSFLSRSFIVPFVTCWACGWWHQFSLFYALLLNLEHNCCTHLLHVNLSFILLCLRCFCEYILGFLFFFFLIYSKCSISTLYLQISIKDVFISLRKDVFKKQK